MIIKGLTGFVTLLLVSLITPSSYACLPQGALYVTVSPQCPTPGDSVTVGVYAGFPDQCWSPARLDSSTLQGNLMSIYSTTVHCGCICGAMPLESSFEVPVGPLPPDSYSVTVMVSIDTGNFAGTYICDSSFSVVVMGDTNGNRVITSADIILLVNHVFKGGSPPCGRSGDVNCDGILNSADVIYLVGYLFKSGPPPVEFCRP